VNASTGTGGTGAPKSADRSNGTTPNWTRFGNAIGPAGAPLDPFAIERFVILPEERSARLNASLSFQRQEGAQQNKSKFACGSRSLRLCQSVSGTTDGHAERVSATSRRFLKLANEANQAYAKAALTELAAEFRKAADIVERRIRQAYETSGSVSV